MTDPTTGGGPDPEARCPWCSTVLPAGATTCPSCGAAVTGAASSDDAAIPGVTSIDPVTAARKPIKQPNRLVSWLAGDLDPLPEPDPLLAVRTPVTNAGTQPLAAAGPDSLAPPSAEVRLEMARLELEAIKAELEASAPEAEPPSASTPASDPSHRSPGEGGASG